MRRQDYYDGEKESHQTGISSEQYGGGSVPGTVVEHRANFLDLASISSCGNRRKRVSALQVRHLLGIYKNGNTYYVKADGVTKVPMTVRAYLSSVQKSRITSTSLGDKASSYGAGFLVQTSLTIDGFPLVAAATSLLFPKEH